MTKDNVTMVMWTIGLSGSNNDQRQCHNGHVDYRTKWYSNNDQRQWPRGQQLSDNIRWTVVISKTVTASHLVYEGKNCTTG